MPETPTFSRYAEIPYDEMTPEQQEGCRALIETGGPLGGPRKIWVHNPKLAKATGPLARISTPQVTRYPSASARSPSSCNAHVRHGDTFVFADHGSCNMSRDCDRSALPVHEGRSVVGWELGRASAQTAIDEE